MLRRSSDGDRLQARQRRRGIKVTSASRSRGRLDLARLATALLAIGLSACAGSIDYRLTRVTPSLRHLQSAVPPIRAALQSPAEGAGPLPANGTRIANAWAEAVAEALQRSGMFGPSQPPRLVVDVTIQGLSGPNPVESDLSVADARYVVRLGEGGPVLLDTTILTDGLTNLAVGDDPSAIQRDARNRAVRANINRFLGALESIDPTIVRRSVGH